MPLKDVPLKGVPLKDVQVLQLPELPILLNQPCFCLADGTLFRQIENEAVVLHISSGMYYSLNETGILIWQALHDRQPLHVAVDRVVASYEVEREQVIQDLQTLLSHLLNYKLVLPDTASDR